MVYIHLTLQSVYQDHNFSEFDKPCDTHLETDDGTEFKVYSVLLSRHSKFFGALFSIEEEVGKTTVIHGIEPGVFEMVLIYLYTSRIDLTTGNMMELLIASDFLMIESLLSECQVFVLRNKTVENCARIFLTAHRIQEFDIEYRLRRFFLMFFEKVIENSMNVACEMPFGVLKYFLSHRSVNITEESVIWSLISAWVRSDPSKRMGNMPELLRCLSINEIGDELALDIISSPIILKNTLYNELGDPRVTLQYLDDRDKARTVIIYRNDVPFINGVRQPPFIYFLTKREFPGVGMFISYDDNLDVWRKLGHMPYRHLKLFRVEHRIYIMEVGRYWNTDIKGFRYDLLRDDIKGMAPIPHSFSVFRHVVEIAGHVYVLGDIYGRFRYVDETDEWTEIMTIQGMRDLGAVGLNGFLYVIGIEREDMVMQVYDPTTEECMPVSSPAISRIYFASVVYLGKIFLMGGYHLRAQGLSREVEVYDPLLNEWVQYPDLLFEYHDISPVVWKGRLILFDYQRPLTPVTVWDGSGEWKIVDEGSPLLKLSQYCFCPIEGVSVVREVMKKNKSADVSDWEESSLNKELL